MDIKRVIQSKIFIGILCGIGTIIITLIIFQAGMFVGYHKAAFSYRWGEDYYRTFGDKKVSGKGEMMKGFSQDFSRGGFPNPHGVVGKIIKINLPTIIIEGKDNIEKIVTIKEGTTIRKFRDDIKSTDLKINDTVTIIGFPDDDDQIEARLIRLMPDALASSSKSQK